MSVRVKWYASAVVLVFQRERLPDGMESSGEGRELRARACIGNELAPGAL